MRRSFLQIRWKSLLHPWQQVDWWLFALPVGLTILGGVMIGSVELKTGSTGLSVQHWVTGAVGLVLAMAIARQRYEPLAQWHWITYGITIASLLMVKAIGSEGELGAQRWINILGFHVQPSEFAKIGVIVTIAAILSVTPATTLPAIGRILALIAIPWALVFLEPNLGTSLIFGAITLGMLYWSGAKLGWLLLLLSPLVSAILFNVYLPAWFFWAAIVGAVAWNSLPWYRVGTLLALAVNLVSGGLGQFLWSLLKDYQKRRLIIFLDPNQDPLDSGYHLIQSRIAVGAGGLWGRGLHQGTQTQLNFIPEQHTDFIFTAIGEELGFIGSMLVLLVFWMICLRLVIIAQNAKDLFGSLIVIGVLSMLMFQVVVNVGMTIGLSPVTGIPLPWLSYAKFGTLMNYVAIGLVQSVANYRQRKLF